jgi:hypothetical protein
MQIFILGLIFFAAQVSAHVVEPSWIKPQQEVRVCFAQGIRDIVETQFFQNCHESLVKRDKLGGTSLEIPRFSQEQKEMIYYSVMKAYTSERTGVHFTGWHDCESDPEAELQLISIRDGANQQYFGECNQLSYRNVHGEVVHGKSFSPKRDSNYQTISEEIAKKSAILFFFDHVANSNLKLVSFKERLAMVSLHEFGHAVGLRHERDAGYGEFENIGTSIVTSAPDAQSIMAQGYLWKLWSQLGLRPSFRFMLGEAPANVEVLQSWLNHYWGENPAQFAAQLGLVVSDSSLIKVVSFSLFESGDATYPVGIQADLEIKIDLSQNDVQALKQIYH